jgi:hypothetical protein
MSNNIYSATPVTTIGGSGGGGGVGGMVYNTTNGLLPNPVPTINMTDLCNSHRPSLCFKLIKASNGFILEVGPDRSYADIANGLQSPKKDLYIIDDIQNMGERITQILSLHLLSKD